jgi:hypothetical protein
MERVRLIPWQGKAGLGGSGAGVQRMRSPRPFFVDANLRRNEWATGLHACSRHPACSGTKMVGLTKSPALPSGASCKLIADS